MGKVKVSNGNETLEIDGADLSAAVKDGYKPTERIIVSNSKETYEIDPNDVESALNEGFSYSDIIKKNVGSQPSSTEPVAPTKDLLTLSKERQEAKGKISVLSSPTKVSAPGGYIPAPDTEPYKKQLAEANEAIKAQGGDEQLAEDIWDIPQGEGFSMRENIPGLMKLRAENKYAYNRELGSIKSKGNLFNAIRDKDGIKSAHELIGLQQQLETQDYRKGTQNAMSLVNQFVDDPDDQAKIRKNIVADKSYDYGIQPIQPDERFASMNPYQQRAMQFLEDVDPATFQAYQRVLSVNPDEQWTGSREADIKRGFEMKGKELENIGMNLQTKALEERLTNLNQKAATAQMTPEEKDVYDKEKEKLNKYDNEISERAPKGDEKVEYNGLLEKLNELDQKAKNQKLAGYEIARYNRWVERMDEITGGSLKDVYNKRNESVNSINQIVEKYKGKGLSPKEQQEYEQRQADYQTLAQDKKNQGQRYPTQAIVDADQLMQEALGNKNSVGKKFALGVGENFDDAINWVGDLLQQQSVLGDLELLGDKQMSGVGRYTSEDAKIIGTDFVAKFEPKLQKQIDEVKGSKLSDEQKQNQVRDLILNNQDQVEYIPNDKAGKSNFTAKAIFNTVGDVASDLVGQVAIAYLSGGASATTKIGELASLFGSTFATAYNDYYNDALQKNIPNPTQYAITHTSIEAASELINNDFEVARKIMGKSGTIGKVLNAVSKDQWDTFVKKGFFSKLKNVSIQTGKTALGNSLQEAKEEVAGQLVGNIADQRIFNKETGVGEGVKDTFIQTMVGMLPLGLLSLPFNYHNINRTQKYAMYEAGMNPDKFIQAITQGLNEGMLTPQEAEARITNVKKAAQAVQSSPAIRIDGTPMTDNEKTEYAFNQSVLQEIKEQKKNAPDSVKEKLEKEEEVLNLKQAQILKPKSSKELIEEGRTEDLEGINKKIEKAEKDELPKREIDSLQKQKDDINKYYDNQLALIPQESEEQKLVNKGLGDGSIKGSAKAFIEEAVKDPQELQGALKEIASQAHDPNSANQAIESFGQEIVDKAKELFPLVQQAETDASVVPSSQEQTQEPVAVVEAAPQQTAAEEIIINTPEDFENELSKIFTDADKEPIVEVPSEMGEELPLDTDAAAGVKAVLPATQRAMEVKKPKKAAPKLNKKEQEAADYAYKNTYRFFKQKYPDIDVDEYNRLRSAKAQQPLPKLGEINAENNQRPRNEDVTQYTPQSIIQKAREFYKNDPIIGRVLDFLEPIIKANPIIKIDAGFQWDKGEYEGQRITNQALGYSFPSGSLILNFSRMGDYDTLFRTAIHELVHAATRSEINTNKAFNEDLKKILSDVRRAMKLPEGDSVVETLVRDGIISQDYEGKYGAANEHELLAEVFSNEKFYNFLKGLEYKGDNFLHRLFLVIAKFFSSNYKKVVGAKENISADNLADYLMQLTESVISGQQEISEGNALPSLRPAQREVLKNIVSKARDKDIPVQFIRDKLKQIADLTEEEIDAIMEETPLPAFPTMPSRELSTAEIGIAPKEPKRKGKLRRFREKYFDRAKGMPDWILKLKSSAKGTVHLEVRQALQLIGKVREMAKQIKFEDWDLFDKALRSQYYGSDLVDLKALPPEMQILAVQMRNKIDGLSRDLIINNYVTPEQALNIEANTGEYMTRSYRAFYEKDWSKKVPQKAREDAFRLLKQQAFNRLLDENEEELQAGTITEEELIEQAHIEASQDLQSIIDGISDKYVPPKINVQKGKDLGILKQRKDIPKEIREVLGEYTDPGVNFAMTIARIASLKSSAEYLTSVKNEGMGEIFFEEDSRPPGASVQIRSEGSETWNPLNGLYTTPDVKEIFDETEIIRNKWVQLWLKIVGAIKWAKTVGSAVTQVKNFESNAGFAVMNGYYRAGESSQSFRFFKDKMFGGEKSQDAMIEKVIRLGVVDQSIGVRELKDMFASDSLDSIILNSGLKGNTPLRKVSDNLVGKPIKFLNKLYGASDDFWKVYGFLNEAQMLSKATYKKAYYELTEDEQATIDLEASERVKNVNPTYDRVWEGAKSLSKGLPIFGNFLSFQAESVRVLLNSFGYAIKDLKTDGRRLIGAQRLAGIGAYLGARSMILYTISQMTGVGMAGLLAMASDDDEDQKLKDVNRYSPDFIRSGDKLVKDHGDGKYTVYDIGGLEPYGVWFKTMNAYNEGNDIVKEGGLAASATELLSPFMELEMTFKTALNVYNNKNDFDSRIYNPVDESGDKMLDVMEYVIKKSSPSTIDFIKRVYKKEDKANELAALFGGRGYDVDIPKNFSFKLKAAEDLFDANRDALNKIKFNKESTEDDIQKAQLKFEERTNKIVKMLSEDYKAAIRLGAKIESLDETLDKKPYWQGYNKNVKNQIKSGIVEEESTSDEIKEWQP